MKMLMILHEATRTGAPRIGGLVASALSGHFDVAVVVLKDGPLRGWLIERIGKDRIAIAERGPIHLGTFDDRVDHAKSILARYECDIVYVNSLASSEFVVAAKAMSRRVILHVHEKLEEIGSLLRAQITKMNAVALADALILAGDDLIDDLEVAFNNVPERRLTWGIAVDSKEVLEKSREGGLAAINIDGAALQAGARLRIGMVGHASRRKGADIFLDVARMFPEHDFIWVGNWEEVEAPDNAATHQSFLTTPISNIYFTGGVDNPFKYMKLFDLFCLTSREDPNPVVLAEAMFLQVPVVAFSRTTAVAEFLGRRAILIHGAASVQGIARLVGAMDVDALRSGVLSAPIEEVKRRFDVDRKIDYIVNLLNSVVEENV